MGAAIAMTGRAFLILFHHAFSVGEIFIFPANISDGGGYRLDETSLRNFATDGKGTPSSGSERGRRAYLGVLTSEWRGELGAALETLA